MTNLTLTRDGVYRSPRPMTDEDLLRAAPSALQAEAHGSRSDKYQIVPTMKIVEALREATGVEVFGATQAHTRKEDKRGHTKHVLRLRRPDADDTAGETPELVLTNSYDGSSSYQLRLGCYRFVCANGMICGDTWDSARVKHIGFDALPQVVDETRRLAKRFDTIRDTVERFKQIALEPDEIRAFGTAAIALRHDTTREDVRADDMTRPRRNADLSNDLWTVFNRAQESVVRGGYFKTTYDDKRRPSHRRVRPVKGIDQNSSLNRAVWTLAEEMAKIKA